MDADESARATAGKMQMQTIKSAAAAGTVERRIASAQPRRTSGQKVKITKFSDRRRRLSVRNRVGRF